MFRGLVILVTLVAGTLEAAPLKVALYVDDGCRGSGVIFWAEMLRDSPDVELQLVDGADIRAGTLNDRELLVMPGGWGGPQYAAMGDEGAAKLKAFVAGGGKYFGTCCGMAIALNEVPTFAKRLKMLPLKRKPGSVRGGFVATVQFAHRGLEWLGLTQKEWGIHYHNGPVVEPTEPVPMCTDFEVLATLDCELVQKGKIEGPMYGTPAAVRAKYGRGEMLAFNCHPEMMPATRPIVVAGIRALTGRTISLVTRPLKPRGAERVGYFTGKLDCKAAVEGYFRLRDNPSVDVVPVTQSQLDEGMSARFDRIVRPNTLIQGPYPLLVTPWTADAKLDVEILVKEADYVDSCGVGGIIWPTAGEVLGNLSAAEYEAGLRALATRAVAKGYGARMTAVCPGKNSAEALVRVRLVQKIADETGARMGILARPPDDATSQAMMEAHYEALAKMTRLPVIIQTYNAKKTTPQPSVELLVKLAAAHPGVYGYVKEESPGLKVNDRMAELLKHPEMKAVLSGWGGKGWMFQGTKIGTRGVISQRPAYASLFVRIYDLIAAGRDSSDPELASTYAKYLYMCNLGDTFAETDDTMRGPHLYVLERLGIFCNRLTRDGKGRLTDFPMTDLQKREIDQRMRYCGLLR